MTSIVIIGAGGFGREALDVVKAIQRRCLADTEEKLDVLGYLDDGTPDRNRLERVGARLLGPVAALADLPPGTRYVIAIADPAARRTIDRAATAAGLAAITLVHPEASIGDDVVIEPGVIICAGARVTTNIHLGRHVHLHVNATVGHDTRIHAYATVNPLAAISGNVTLGEECTVGTTACVNQGLAVGDRSFVASGAAVTRDVPAGVLVAGVPAVIKKTR